MAKNLVIVESPAKAGTIKKYLGPDFEVLASMGHIRDLPASKLGVDVEDNFLPSYVIPTKARKNLKKLKDALKGVETVYLATDLDREGEAIAWHVQEALDLTKTGQKIERITFDQITKEAVTNAVKNPRRLNEELIDAQQARRVLDRLVGYTLSPLLWKKIYKGLSAGRVQSVALRLIVDRELERKAFNPEEYWSLEVLLGKSGVDDFVAKLIEWQGEKVEKMTLKDEKQVGEIVKELDSEKYSVEDIATKNQSRKPQAPYTTSSFQQDAVNKLNMSAKQAMRLAQQLYEAGHITYMRTDSVALADEFVQSVKGFVTKEWGEKYLPATARVYATKAKNAQEAHEAIRPTSLATSPEKSSDDVRAQQVYELIMKRAVASQMADATVEQTAVTIKAGKGLFKANGQRIVFPGYLAMIGKEGAGDNILPELTKGEVLELRELKPEQHFTEPPPRFSEATLIKALEEQGIGRPSTYAPTMDTLVQRNYVHLDQRRFVPEEAGYLVTALLKEHFPEIVDFSFTAQMEDKLDNIADGTAKYATVLEEFWKPFIAQVEDKKEKIEKVATDEESEEVCPTCGSPMIIKRSRFGKFLACTKFPDCKTTKNLEQEEQKTGLICPIDGADLIWKRSRRGQFLGCSKYPDCKFAAWKKEQLAKKIAELEKEEAVMPFKEQALEAFNKFPDAS